MKPTNPIESRLKHRAQTEFMLQHNKLYYKPTARFQNPRCVILESDAFDTIINEHLQLLHAGRTKTWNIIQRKFYGLKREEVEFIIKRSFLPPKIMQADNGKEFKGALLILLRKYGIQVINGAPRSPQTQGLVEQANGVVENKLRAWKMDHGSMEWKDGLLEVMLAMNTQIHSTIGCAPAKLLFRDRSSHINWLNSQARKDLLIGVEQEDPTMAPILE
ncbi:hypothetical protein V499_02234, partial [Pseudogymnoascus sp. VKM F-103]